MKSSYKGFKVGKFYKTNTQLVSAGGARTFPAGTPVKITLLLPKVPEGNIKDLDLDKLDHFFSGKVEGAWDVTGEFENLINLNPPKK